MVKRRAPVPAHTSIPGACLPFDSAAVGRAARFRQGIASVAVFAAVVAGLALGFGSNGEGGAGVPYGAFFGVSLLLAASLHLVAARPRVRR